MTKEDLTKIAQELNLPVDVIERTYKAYWYFIKSTIESLPLKEDLSEEQFNNLRCNFNIPSLGKLSCTSDKYKRIKDRYNYIKNLKNDIKDK